MNLTRGQYFRIAKPISNVRLSSYGLPEWDKTKDIIWRFEKLAALHYTEKDILAYSVNSDPRHCLTLIAPSKEVVVELLTEEDIDKIQRRLSWFKMYKSLDIKTHPRTKMFR